MMPSGVDRIGTYVFVMLFAALMIAGALFLLPVYRDYRAAKQDLVEVERKLTDQKERIVKMRREITRLKTDYRAIERVARERFGYCRDGEKIYHFDTPETSSP